MKKYLASLLLAGSLVALAAAPARAEFPPDNSTTTFEAVDGVTVLTPQGDAAQLRVEGLVQGETESRTLDIKVGSGATDTLDRCLKLLLIAQSRPGRYAFEIRVGGAAFLRSCKLKSR